MTDTGETLSPSLLSTKAPCMSPKGFIDRRETDPGSPEKRMSPGRGSRQDWPRKVDEEEPLAGAAHFSFVSAAGPPSLDDVHGEDTSLLRAHTGHLVHPGDFQTQHPKCCT